MVIRFQAFLIGKGFWEEHLRTFIMTELHSSFGVIRKKTVAVFTAFLLMCKLLASQTQDKAIKHYPSASLVNGKMKVDDNVGDPHCVPVLPRMFLTLSAHLEIM